MAETAPRTASRARNLISFSSVAGLVAAVTADVSDEMSKTIERVAAKEFLAGIAALGAAFGAIAVAVLALVAVWFDRDYLTVLEQPELGGWDAAMRPFKRTATVSLLACLVSILGIFVYPVSPLALQALILGLAGGLLTWSLVGTLRLVDLLFKHGHLRAKLMMKASPKE